MQCPVCGGEGFPFVDDTGRRGFDFRHADSCPLSKQTPPYQG